MTDYGDTTYDTGYDTSFDSDYTTTSYAEYTYDTSWGYGDPAADAGWTEISSYSYDSPDWGAVADVSQSYVDDYYLASDAGWELWNASTDAYLAGDTLASYDLNSASLEVFSMGNDAWADSSTVWTAMDETTTVTTWDTGDDSGW